MGKLFAISERFVQVLLAEEATRKAQYTHNEALSLIGTSLVFECVWFALEGHQCISFAGFSWPGKTSIRSVYRGIANPGPTLSWKVT